MKKFVLGMSFAALLAGVANVPGEKNVAHAAEKKLWNPIPNYTQKGEPFQVRNFYYDKGDIAENEVVTKEVIYIDKAMQLYDDSNGKPLNVWLAPQLIEITNGTSIQENSASGYFLEVKTWLGPKWIKWTFPQNTGHNEFPSVKMTYPVSGKGSEVFQSVSNKTNIPIYKTPGYNGVVDGYIAPQELAVTSVGLGDFNGFYNHGYISVIDPTSSQNGYIGIQTWLGERWVKVSDIDTEVINQEIYPVTNSNMFRLYESPERNNTFNYTGLAITAQKVEAIQRKGQFIQIKTWMGDKWIEADEYISNLNAGDVFVPGETTISMKPDTKHYDHPEYSGIAEKIINPEVIKSTGAFYKGNGEVWYYNEMGKWVSGEEVDSITQATGKIENTRNMELYGDDFYSDHSYLTPQTLDFKSKLGNWYLINTWIGDKWVKVGQDDTVTVDEKDLTLTENVQLYKTAVKVDSQLAGDVTAQVVKEVGRQTVGKEKWIQVKVPSTNQEGWILEV
ncbi:hypothetical protein bcgnr5372_27130 [Bacillus luti]|nr:hypothetical protein [Bacillus cereus]HDR8329713.1 hypothetical protein [Bacillus cereus]HDR8336570.1 hypothetical protein [Bacillus cereus]